MPFIKYMIRTKEGELKVVTEWHNVAVYQEKLANFVMSNIQKGYNICFILFVFLHSFITFVLLLTIK